MAKQQKDLVSNTTAKILVVLIVVVVIAVIYKIYQASKKASSVLGDIAGSQIIAAQTGISVPRQQVCTEVAQSVRSACTIVPWVEKIVWVTDEDVVVALNRLIGPSEASLASVNFKELTGKSLKTDVVDSGFMVDNSRAAIKADVKQGLK